nr:PREDICTED: uncharacterized protein LOC109029987 [Bemisia tabaci]
MWFEDPGTEEFRGLNLKTLDVDEAYLNITLTPDAPQSLHLYSLTSNCHQINISLKQKYDVYHRISRTLRVPGVPAPPIGLVAAAFQLCNNDELATIAFLKQQWGAVAAMEEAYNRRRRQMKKAKKIRFPKADNPAT